MKLRTNIFAVFGTFMIALITVLCVINLAIVRHNLRDNAEKELVKYHTQVVQSAQTLLHASIQSYLKGITEKNLEFVQYYYDQYKMGKMSEHDAKDTIQKIFSRQTVGKTGYLVAVERQESKLILALHPFQKGVDCTESEGCQAWDSISNGIVEYEWQNPTDDSHRLKVSYVREFKPWNWIVGASSYKDEFVDLVNLDDLRKLIKPIQILKSGYFYVYDQKNDKFLIHPQLENQNSKKVVDPNGKPLMPLLVGDPDGHSTYSWKNPSDKEYREKFSYISKIEWYDWYIAASGYVEEIYEPISFLTNITIAIVLCSLIIFIALCFWFSQFLTDPLTNIKRGIISFNQERKPFFWKQNPIEEIDYLGTAVSEMSHSLSVSMEENRQTAFSLDQIINAMPSLIIKVTTNLDVVLCNRNSMELRGLSASEVEGVPLMELIPQLLPLHDDILRGISEMAVSTLKLEFPESAGTYRHWELTIIPLLCDDSGKAVLRIDDITSRQNMERQLHQSQKMDAVGRLAGGIAHDFNNALAGILGATELLKSSTFTQEEQTELFDLILTAASRAGELTKKLLTFSRKGAQVRTAVDCSKIIRDTASLLKHTIDKNITVSVENLSKDATIIGDDSLLQNAFMNMGINASHAMPEGGELTFTLENLSLDEEYCELSPFEIKPGNYLEISIRDTGTGMSQEVQSRIFEPFFTTKEQGKGTGLGMAAVYGTVQEHSGAITLYSEPGSGTVFHIYFPLSENPSSVDRDEQKVSKGTGTVLIIDDEELIRITASAMLLKLGYRVICAENGFEGVKVFAEISDQVDLILLDMIMPVMGGREAFVKLREIDPDIPVIIASGFAKEEDIQALKGQGVSGFLHKPFRRIELAEMVAEAMKVTE